MSTELSKYSMQFDGNLLARGFWLYVWEIIAPSGVFLYVGRTGDSSSANASSPFKRIGQHLDLRENAKGNAIARQLRKVGVNCVECKFKMAAVGPLHPEQSDFELHKPIRDRVAALEHAVAIGLGGRGYHVLGFHQASGPPDAELLREVQALLDADFPGPVIDSVKV